MRACECKIFGISAARLARRFRRGRGRTFPSPRSIHDFLARFHDAEAGQKRVPGKAIVPEPVAKLAELLDVSRTRIAMVAKDKGLTHVTLDMDATIVPSGKREATHACRSATGSALGETGCQPLLVFCPELGMVLHMEFRDGNVPASFRNVEALDAALGMLPEDIKTVTPHSDAAGHQEALLKYRNDPSLRPERNGAARFATIGFVISAIGSEALTKKIASVGDRAWIKLDRDSACGHPLWGAEVPLVSNTDASHMKDHPVRYVMALKPTPRRLGAGLDELPLRAWRRDPLCDQARLRGRHIAFGQVRRERRMDEYGDGFGQLYGLSQALRPFGRHVLEADEEPADRNPVRSRESRQPWTDTDIECRNPPRPTPDGSRATAEVGCLRPLDSVRARGPAR